mmetsp:Transcript_28141/g.62791  ORF Transcript_28141/g.62791 Transcript_28141/m.62791 type:complete len:474 (+) Transcript_28141:217-1638(+)
MILALAAKSRRARRYSVAYEDTADGPPCWAQVMLFFGGLGSIGFGVSMLWASTQYGREHKVYEFARKTANWTEARMELVRTNFSLGSKIGQRERQPYNFYLPEDKSAEVSLAEGDAEDASDLPAYKPLRYHADGAPHDLLPTLNWTLPAGTETAQFVLTAAYHPPGGAAPVVSTLATEPVWLWTRQVVPGRTPVPEQKCPQQQHGVWVKGRCEIYSRIQSLCVVVDFDPTTKTWAFAPKKGDKDPLSYGCVKRPDRGQGLEGDRESSRAEWRAPRYTLAKVTAKTSGVGKSQKVLQYHFPLTELDDVQFTVRSAHDPLVEAAKITRGKLDFGVSVHTAFVLGIVSLILGACLAVAPAYAFYKCYADYLAEQKQVKYSRVFNDDRWGDDDDGDAEAGEFPPPSPQARGGGGFVSGGGGDIELSSAQSSAGSLSSGGGGGASLDGALSTDSTRGGQARSIPRRKLSGDVNPGAKM